MSEASASAPAASAAPAAAPAATNESNNTESSEAIEASAEEGAPEEGALEEQIKEEINKKLGKKKLKLKVDGQEFEEELDLDDEEGLKKHLQLSKAAQKRMQEYSTLRKEVEDLVKLMKENPELVLERAGHDVDKLAEDRIARRLEDMKKSPEQKEKEEMQKKIQEYENRLKEKEEAQARAEQEKVINGMKDQFDREIEDALTEHKDLPKSPYVVKRLADYMIYATKMAEDPNSGIDAERITVKNMVPLVKQSIKSELQQMFGQLPEADLEALLGDNVNRLRKHRLASAKAAPKETSSQIKPTGNEVKPRVEEKKIKAKDFFKSLGNK